MFRGEHIRFLVRSDRKSVRKKSHDHHAANLVQGGGERLSVIPGDTVAGEAPGLSGGFRLPARKIRGWWPGVSMRVVELDEGA